MFIYKMCACSCILVVPTVLSKNFIRVGFKEQLNVIK